MDKTLIVLIVTFGLAFVVLIANFVVVPVLTGLTLWAFGFTAQATMAFALLSVVAGAPFVAMFTKLGHGDAAYAATISLILLLVTIPFMPLVLPWMLSLLNVPHAGVDTWHLLEPLLGFLLLPLLIGLAIRWRYPGLAQQLAPHFSQVALVGVALHITLMFVAYWGQVVAEVHTGEYLYSIVMAVACLIVGYGVCLLFLRGAARAAGQGIVLPASLGTAQKGSQALICSLIFAIRLRDRQTARQALTPAGQPSHQS